MQRFTLVAPLSLLDSASIGRWRDAYGELFPQYGQRDIFPSHAHLGEGMQAPARAIEGMGAELLALERLPVAGATQQEPER